jgi:copper chaperone CopZ
MIQTITFTISDMHCVSCAMNIDGELEDTPGVLEATTNYAKQTSQIKFNDEQISPEQIKAVIAKTGYEVK